MNLQSTGDTPAKSHHRFTMLCVVMLICTGCTPSIHDYAARGDVDAITQLLSAAPDRIDATNKLGKTPLHYAASHYRLDSMQTLIEHNPDVNAQDQTGMTPLHICAGRNYRPLLRFLIQNGADISIQDDFGDTPLHAAAMHGATECVNDLLKVKANPWTKNHEGLTPMQLAERHGHQSIANRFKLMTPPDEETDTP